MTEELIYLRVLRGEEVIGEFSASDFHRDRPDSLRELLTGAVTGAGYSRSDLADFRMEVRDNPHGGVVHTFMATEEG